MSTSRLELQNDSMIDEASMQTLKCANCGTFAFSAYEESRRGSLDSEYSDAWAFTVSQEDYQKILNLNLKCPNPDKFDCDCSAHKLLGEPDSSGRWKKLSQFKAEKSFKLES